MMSVAAHLQGYANRQVAPRRIGVVEESVDMGRRRVVAVGQRANGVAHQPFGIVHQIFAGVADDFQAVFFDQREIAAGADLGGLDLRLHVADDEVGRADVVAQHMPDRVVAPALVEHFDRLELQAFGERIDGVDDAATARRQRADIQMMGGGRRKSDQLARLENRHAERDVGPMRGAAVGVVVHDDVARPDLVPALGQHLQDAPDIAGYRSRLQRRAHLAFAQLPPLRVGERGAEILGFANDAGIAHPHQFVTHLDRDVLQRPLNDRGRDRIDAGRRGAGLQ